MAMTDYFLQIEGLHGREFEDPLPLLSWSFGEKNSSGTFLNNGPEAGKLQMLAFSFTKGIDWGSPKLFLACAEGKHISAAILTCRTAGGEQIEFMKVKLSDVLVSSYESTSGDFPSETVTLSFAKIEYEYKGQKPDGSRGSTVKVEFDVSAMKTS
jgi:type VI secretion system secreted protein Hcp